MNADIVISYSTADTHTHIEEFTCYLKPYNITGRSNLLWDPGCDLFQKLAVLYIQNTRHLHLSHI